LHGLLLFGTGVTMSLGHCVGMCGPIVATFSLSQRSATASALALAPALTLYHAGRITSYTAIGMALGLLGSATGALSGTQTLQAALAIAVGIAMLLLGFGLLGLLPTQRWVESSSLAGWVASRIRGLLGTRRRTGQYALGIANGFLPCGPVAVLALGAATAGSAVRGGLSLLVYGLGTLPALVILGLGTGWLGATARVRLYRLGSVLVLLLAAQLLARGLASLGVLPHWTVGSVMLW
jgi:sulfite exporter TauE/SafE